MITAISRARDSYAEVILHDGADACADGGEPYMDNSRTSKVCKEHRAEYQKWQKQQRKRANPKIAMPRNRLKLAL